MTRSPRTAWRTTAAAPSRLPPAATSAYHRALDRRALPSSPGERLLHALEQRLPRVARRVLEHVPEQPLQHLAHIRTRPDAGGDQVVALDGQVGKGEGVLRRANGGHDL